ncbi:CopG family transcriptional regulator [candidate division KSB1 bacterium]|nr:CopG family transcriptional regulator [candidate division KSB1 bacterium]
MIKNITVTIDEDLFKKAKKIAIDKNTTLTAMIRKFLLEVVEREILKKDTIIKELKNLFETSDIRVGSTTWKREELYER